MQVIVIGLGEVGQSIARPLSQGQDVTIVDRDLDRVEAMQGELDALVVAGNGASPRTPEDGFLRQVTILARGSRLIRPAGVQM